MVRESQLSIPSQSSLGHSFIHAASQPSVHHQAYSPKAAHRPGPSWRKVVRLAAGYLRQRQRGGRSQALRLGLDLAALVNGDRVDGAADGRLTALLVLRKGAEDRLLLRGRAGISQIPLDFTSRISPHRPSGLTLCLSIRKRVPSSVLLPGTHVLLQEGTQTWACQPPSLHLCLPKTSGKWERDLLFGKCGVPLPLF